MDISRKIVLAVASIVPAFTVVVLILLKSYIVPEFIQIEKSEMHKSLLMAKSYLNRELLATASYAKDYARWDDTYTFIEKYNAPYLASNYEPSSMLLQKINLVCILDNSGSLKFSRLTDNNSHEIIVKDFMRASGSLGKLIQKGVMDKKREIKGLIATSKGIMLISSYPVTDSLAKKKPNGRLIAARFLDENLVKSMGDTFMMPFSLLSLPQSTNNQSPIKLSSLQNDEGIHITNSPDNIDGYLLLLDYNAKPIHILHVHRALHFVAKSLKIIHLVTTVLIILSGLFISLVLLYLKGKILKPITAFTKKTSQITSDSDFRGRLPENRKDEVGTLARSFNLLLDNLASINNTLEEKVKIRTKELELSNEALILMGKVFENSLEGIAICDQNKIIQEVNTAYTRITGFSKEEVVDKIYDFRKTDRHDENFYQQIWNKIATSGYWNGELWTLHKNGRAYPQWLSISTIKEANGDLKNYLFVFHDISDSKAQEGYIKYLAFHDPLTGLPNREVVYQRIKMAMDRYTLSKKRMALLYLDLDNFKSVNDSLGHDYGDKLLQHVAERLQKLIRPTDTVSRLGGDEFIIILEELTDDKQAEILAQRIIHSFANPFVVKEQLIHIGSSIGITSFPKDGQEISVLIKNADMAMYRAKAEGRRRFHHYSSDLEEIVTKRHIMEGNLRMAILMNQFEVHYQPKIYASSGEILGFEGLTRWRHNDSLVNPGEFIPLAEETGLIISLDRIILETACSEIVQLNRSTGKNYKLALNSSAKAFHQKSFAEEVRLIMQNTGMRPEWLEIEITETDLMKDIDACIGVLNKISEMGISIAMDDFGTGYSSLSQLTRIPLDVLKIDKSFVEQIGSPVCMVDRIFAMGKDLKLTIVAEGVETKEQLQYLKNLGCDLIQGYYYSRPLAFHALEEYLKNHEVK